jgi:hypothetical protein
VLGLDQATRLVFRGTEELAWRSDLSVPVFWTSLFTRDDLTATGAAITWQAAMRNAERRQNAWQSRASERMLRGLGAFVDWVRDRRGGSIELDLRGLHDWRRAPLLAAVGDLIDFLDSKRADPGELLAREETVGWRKRKGGIRLEALSADLAWPDELPMFDVHDTELVAATTGKPPFRRGPWPERRFAEDELAPMPPDVDAAVKQRARLVYRALQVYRAGAPVPKSPGNLEAVARERTRIRALVAEFETLAAQLAGSAADFARVHQVFDDGALWAALRADAQRWLASCEAAFSRYEAEIRDVMKALQGSDGSNEIDFDNFPSGDDPF